MLPRWLNEFKTMTTGLIHGDWGLLNYVRWLVSSIMHLIRNK